MKRLLSVLLMVCLLAVAVPVMSIAAGTSTTLQQGAKINLNNGSAAELQALPGIGAVTAERIVTFRKHNGPFASLDDLVKVKGIGAKTLEKIRPMIKL